MPLIDAPVRYLASVIRQPSNLLPILLLVLQKDSLISQVLPYLDDYVVCFVDFASDVKRFDCISYISYGVSLGLFVFDWNLCILIVGLQGEQIDSTLS